MPDSAGSAGRLRVFITGVPLVLGAFLAFAAARAYGVTWKGVLHWSGETLLVIGISLAAKGIADVRRGWTGLPGIAGRMRGHWNRLLKHIPGLVRILHLRPFIKKVTVTLPIAWRTRPSRLGPDNWGIPPSNSSYEERLAWLETCMLSAGARINALDAWIDQEAMDRQAATYEERMAREAETSAIRESMANLAGGGLRLQTWGVVCLLVGTIMIAIW